MFIASEADEHVQGPPQTIVFQSRYNKSSGQKQHQRWRLKFQVGKALVDTCLTHPFEQFQWLGKNKRILFHQDETKKWYKKKTKQNKEQFRLRIINYTGFRLLNLFYIKEKNKEWKMNNRPVVGAAHLSGQKTGSLWNKLKMNEKGAVMTPYNVRPRETTALARVIGLAVVMERFDWLVAISPFLNIFDYSGRRCIGHHRMCGMHTEFSIIFFSVVPLPKLLSGSHQYSARRVEQGGRL